MSTATTKHSTRRAASVAIVLLGLISPAGAAAPQQQASTLTSHSPWLAPAGHRQPRSADLPQHELLSAWERQQQQFDAELDHKLIICRDC